MLGEGFGERLEFGKRRYLLMCDVNNPAQVLSEKVCVSEGQQQGLCGWGLTGSQQWWRGHQKEFKEVQELWQREKGWGRLKGCWEMLWRFQRSTVFVWYPVPILRKAVFNEAFALATV